MSFFLINDSKIYYELKGTGETVIFIHAGICDSRMWTEQFNYFANSFKVLRYDLRGFGQSSVAKLEFSHTTDLKKLMDFLNITKANIVACSFGCQIGLDFALEYPNYISSLILVNGRPYGFKLDNEEPHPLWKEATKAFEEKKFTKTAEVETLIWLVGRKRTKEDVEDSLFKNVVEMDKIALQNESASTAKEIMLHPDIVTKLSDLSLPITLIVGSLDEPSIVMSCEKLSMEFDYELYLIDGTAHLPNLEKPREFNELVEKILKNNK